MCQAGPDEHIFAWYSVVVGNRDHKLPEFTKVIIFIVLFRTMVVARMR